VGAVPDSADYWALEFRSRDINTSRQGKQNERTVVLSDTPKSAGNDKNAQLEGEFRCFEF
jgi:hypothetical protein